MSRVLMAGEPGLVGKHVILQLLAIGREVRTMVRSPRAAALVAVVAADRDCRDGRLDDVAGCEFVDDRIHWLE
jgi:uncharacterized protein YbjT (DUF2867 family)